MVEKIFRIKPLEVPPGNIIETLPPPVTQRANPPVIRPLRPPVIDYPQEEIPSYEPIQVQPPVQKPKQEKSDSGGEKEPVQSPPEIPRTPLPTIPNTTPPPPKRGTIIEVPFTELEIPVPTTKEVTLAGTTAIAATSAALLGKSLVDYLLKVMKPAVKKTILAIKKAQGKRFTEFELQDYFLFEHEDNMKEVVKVLEKEQKEEKLRQALEQLEQ